VSDRWYFHVSEEGERYIDPQMSDVSTENAEHYAQAMSQMFYVDRVLMSLKDTVDTAPA